MTKSQIRKFFQEQPWWLLFLGFLPLPAMLAIAKSDFNSASTRLSVTQSIQPSPVVEPTPTPLPSPSAEPSVPPAPTPEASPSPNPRQTRHPPNSQKLKRL
uniref:Uncharacterized protein n=1 Tax=Desertifilum tharense IPPAS B-1220 TaxID=1781255 RepID=A0ACD5H039_9CYAN